MKRADRWIRSWRFAKARPYVKNSLLDIGCHDGAFLRIVGAIPRLGIDSKLAIAADENHVEMNIGELQPTRKFQTISCLATFEHFHSEERPIFWKLVNTSLEANGRLIMTLPQPSVDIILRVAKRLGVLSGIEDHQHTNVEAKEVIAEAKTYGFELDAFEKFQFGLNNLLVFKISSRSATCA